MSAAWVNEVRAEFVMDFYGGFAKIEDSDVQVRVSDVPFSGTWVRGRLTSRNIQRRMGSLKIPSR